MGLRLVQWGATPGTAYFGVAGYEDHPCAENGGAAAPPPPIPVVYATALTGRFDEPCFFPPGNWVGRPLTWVGRESMESTTSLTAAGGAQSGDPGLIHHIKFPIFPYKISNFPLSNDG